MLPSSVKAAAATAMLAGVFGLFDVLQLFGVINHIDGFFSIAPTLMGIESAGSVAAAFFLFRARRWAPWLGAAAGGLLWATSSAWFLFAAMNGFITLFGLLIPLLGLGELVMAMVARKACESTAQARERLAAQGLELGV
jgi:hypothetical protein